MCILKHKHHYKCNHIQTSNTLQITLHREVHTHFTHNYNILTLTKCTFTSALSRTKEGISSIARLTNNLHAWLLQTYIGNAIKSIFLSFLHTIPHNFFRNCGAFIEAEGESPTSVVVVMGVVVSNLGHNLHIS